MHVSVDICSNRASREAALRRPGGRLSFGVHHAYARVLEAPPVSGSFCREAEEAGVGERARETITVGGSSPRAENKSARTRHLSRRGPTRLCEASSHRRRFS